jgi:hypothetical protein
LWEQYSKEPSMIIWPFFQILCINTNLIHIDYQDLAISISPDTKKAEICMSKSGFMTNPSIEE